MGFFDIFKKKTKTSVPLEEQLRTLADLGIRPKHGDFIKWICDEWGKEAVESDPYNLMLFSLGRERERNGSWEHLSDDIYCFDTECVENEDIYQTILERLAILSKGVFNIANVHSVVNHDEQKASVSFTYNGTDHQWNLKYDDDWFDSDVINRINHLLKENGSANYFCTCLPDQNLIVVFETQGTLEKLNRLTTVPFRLGVSNTEVAKYKH